MRYACGERAEEVLLGARTYKGAEAIARGLAHRVVSDDLVEAAVTEAAHLGELPVEAYRDTKAQLRAPAVSRIRQGSATDAEVRQLWGADETQQRIAAYVESLKRRD
jgi:enoyl-CoA hydratase